jgi:hypothetical protein
LGGDVGGVELYYDACHAGRGYGVPEDEEEDGVFLVEFEPIGSLLRWLASIDFL